jgi:hypothetical protein
MNAPSLRRSSCPRKRSFKHEIRKRRHAQAQQQCAHKGRRRHGQANTGPNRKVSSEACGTFRQQCHDYAGNEPARPAKAATGQRRLVPCRDRRVAEAVITAGISTHPSPSGTVGSLSDHIHRGGEPSFENYLPHRDPSASGRDSGRRRSSCRGRAGSTNRCDTCRLGRPYKTR